jgi:hypothetical protein
VVACRRSFRWRAGPRTGGSCAAPARLAQTFSAEDGTEGLWVRLADRSRRARAGYGQRIKLIDQQWQARYGPGLRTTLEGVVDGLDLPYHPIGVFAPVGSTS